VLRREFRNVGHHLIDAHPAGQVFEHIVNRYAGADKTWLAATHASPGLDDRGEIHRVGPYPATALSKSCWPKPACDLFGFGQGSSTYSNTL